MLYTIQNKDLTVTVSSLGAELQSIWSSDGTEYLWQGDPAYWTDRSPNLFPYIGRMIGKQYLYGGKQYPMNIHGFASYLEFSLSEQSDDTLILALTDSEDTAAQYPWKFAFRVCYRLKGNRLEVTFDVENRDDKTMLFAVGGHPGFYMPEFEGARLRFSQSCAPKRILFTADCFVEDHTADYPLEDGICIPLRHDLFDEDAIVLTDVAKAVTLESRDGSRRVTVSYPQMDYIGFWHMPQTDAPYVCIEPWSSLPSRKGTKTVLEEQKDLLRLAPGKTYQNIWTIEIGR